MYDEVGPTSKHQRDCTASGIKGRTHASVQHATPVFTGALPKQASAWCGLTVLGTTKDAIDQNVNMPLFPAKSLKEGLNLIVLGVVALYRDSKTPAGSHQLSGFLDGFRSIISGISVLNSNKRQPVSRTENRSPGC